MLVLLTDPPPIRQNEQNLQESTHVNRIRNGTEKEDDRTEKINGTLDLNTRIKPVLVLGYSAGVQPPLNPIVTLPLCSLLEELSETSWRACSQASRVCRVSKPC